MKSRFGLIAATACMMATVAWSAPRLEEEQTAVYAKVFNDYARTPSAVGGYLMETFAFANGGPVLGGMRDPSVERATFNEVIRLISPALARQNYVAASDPQDTDLLIYVYWGATSGALPGSGLSDGTMEQAMNLDADWYGAGSLLDDGNRRRDSTNFRNAGLLGYRESLARHVGLQDTGIHGTLYRELIADVEEPRYFVILTAFDFRTALDTKHLVPLWSVRYNIPARGNHFTAALPDMSMFASRFFGRDSGGLIRRLNPTGKVDMEDLQILGAVGEPSK